MFDVTLTDIEFNQDFVNKNADWMLSVGGREPDLAVDGLRNSLLSWLIGLFNRDDGNVAR